jgi:riboflavin synthase
MFTGIVQELGRVVARSEAAGGARLSLSGELLRDTDAGDSVATNGVCLTVVERDGDVVTFDVMGETLRRTTLGALDGGSPVNLELAVTPTTRLGGHVVQGHVDGVGTVVDREHTDRWDVVTVRLPEGLARYVVEKGSICLDGVSLTVVSVSGSDIVVSLIPETLRRTTLGAAQVGGLVNVEVDVLAKYVERLLQSREERAS